MDFEHLYSKVFGLHDDIRYAGVIDNTGTSIAGGTRKDTDSIVTVTDEELFLTHTALRKSMPRRRRKSSTGSRSKGVQQSATL